MPITTGPRARAEAATVLRHIARLDKRSGGGGFRVPFTDHGDTAMPVHPRSQRLAIRCAMIAVATPPLPTAIAQHRVETVEVRAPK